MKRTLSSIGRALVPSSLLALSPVLFLGACHVEVVEESPSSSGSEGAPAASSESGAQGTQDAVDPAELEVATLAGGCFWCMEKPFEELPGVHSVISGYTGGEEANPTYSEVSSGATGHTEAVQIHYDPSQVSYAQLLDVFWRQIDPTDAGGQFVDRGSQYRSGIYPQGEEQMRLARESKRELAESGRFDEEIVTEIEPFEAFYEAEEYHQDFYEKKPARYESYRSGSGRDAFLDRVWGADRQVEFESSQQAARSYEIPSREELRSTLSDMEYRVTQEDGTEPPFDNAFWDEKRAGIYVDVISGEPLFSSTDKFESGTGWPSFTRPLEASNVTLGVDHKLGYPRDEVRSKHADSHLGHVFEDGPAPTGLRYCINSAALRFVPASELEAQGYGEYADLFDDVE